MALNQYLPDMKSANTPNLCHNCGISGHDYYTCKQPITSVGIIAYKQPPGLAPREYLLIRRKHTIGYMEFLRGKYVLTNRRYIANLISEMTVQEKQRLQHWSFSELWRELWGGEVGLQYRNEERQAVNKFEELQQGVIDDAGPYNMQQLLVESGPGWEEPEWGFPKGRHNVNEHGRDLVCALREFEEETGYARSTLQLLQNVQPFEEIFTGSNYKSYKHKYFVAEYTPLEADCTQYQASEVSKLSWKTHEEAQTNIRPYSLEKKKTLLMVNCLLDYYTLVVAAPHGVHL